MLKQESHRPCMQRLSCRNNRRRTSSAVFFAVCILAALPNLITSFAPSTSYVSQKKIFENMTNKNTSSLPPNTYVRRTSSLAYDAISNDSERSHNQPNRKGSRDAWRERWNLPPSLMTRSSALSSSRSSTQLTIHEHETNNNDCNDQDDDDARPIYTFGILTDIQYAPIPDGHSYNGTPRYYRHAIAAAEHAARHFEDEKVHCVVNLGDIVDGKCADVERWGGVVDINGKICESGAGKVEDENDNEDERRSSSVGHDAVDDVVKALSSYKSGRILHTYGNHELYNLSREDLGEKLSIPFTLEPTGDLVGYYSHGLYNQRGREIKQEPSQQPLPKLKLRFLVLDTYDISILDRCPLNSPKRHLAHQILSTNNPNYPHNENSPEGLDEQNKRFVAFNGGIDKPQLEWLEQSLQTAKDNDEKIIVFSHQPIHPGSSGPICLVWNYSEVLSILRKYNDIVLASFSGHAHKGGYVRDEESGIHFRTLEAVLESPDPIRTYGMVDVWGDRLEVRGWGDCMSDVYDLDHLGFDQKERA